MKTQVMDILGVEKAAAVIRGGGLVAFPTETVYGLGGNALDSAASAKIYAAKGRPSDNPLIVHVASVAQVRPLVRELPKDGEKLMQAFWPGPLTIVLPKAKQVPYETTGHLDTVAVRMPENACALALINASGVPIAAPSANTSGKPSPTEAAHVYQDLNGKIEMILDGGAVGIGVESTIIDLTGEVPTLLRPGAITKEELEEVLEKQVEIDPAILGGVQEGTAPKAPGMKYRHYAPNAKMFLVEAGDDKAMTDKINRSVQLAVYAGKRAGILCCEETKDAYQCEARDKDGDRQKISRKVLGRRSEPLTMTHNLYKLLREFDGEAVDVIYAESYSDQGIGFALMNRMRKAAGGNVITC